MSKITLARFLLSNNVLSNNIKVFRHKICRDLNTRSSTFLHNNIIQPSCRQLSSKSFEKVKEQPNLYTDDADTFGALSGDTTLFDNRPEDPGDLEEEKFISNPPSPSQKLATMQYADIIKNHLKYKRMKEAIDVLQVRMLKEDRVKPIPYVYNLLISGCARAGYTQMAFKLYNDMKRRKMIPSENVYTSLLISCSNAPWQHDGLKRATYLRNSMQEKGIEPNVVHYNAMIKAFGRNGDIVTAFQIADEMTAKKIKLRTHTFNFLFQACISDKKTGFKHALLTWRKMLERRQKPNIFTFNLMLRCAKDCGMGEEPLDFQTFLTSGSATRLYSYKDRHTKLIADAKVDNESDVQNNQVSNRVEDSPLPNLLSITPHIDNVVTLNNPKTPEERFCMMGGLEGFLREVNLYQVKPNIKMMSQILTLLPSDTESENTLMTLMDKLKMKYDIDFFNMLIKKRCLRLDYESALMVKDLITKYDNKERKKTYFKHKAVIKPDIITYGVLAMCCDSQNKAQDLINEMMERRLRINAEIIGALFKTATIRKDFDYVDFVLKTIDEQEIQVNDAFLEHFKKFLDGCKLIMKNPDIHSEIKENAGKILKKSGELWRKFNKIKETAPINPFDQFKENINTSFQNISNMNPRKRHYYKHRRIAPRYVVKV